MNNILDFQEYRIQVRLYEEQLVREQIMEPIEEGLLSGIRNRINERANNFVKQALSDEIEMGKKLNQEIQEAVDRLKEKIEEIQKYVDEHSTKKSKIFEEVQKIFDEIHKTSFELLEILSGVKINFADYVQNAAMATMVNFGMLTIPMRSTFLLKKSYKYFIGIIKNTIRKDMLMLMLNFDQFENTVLIQSLEDDENSQWFDEMKTRINAYEELGGKLLASTVGKKKGGDEKEAKRIKDAIEALRKGVEARIKLKDRSSSSIGFDAKYDNTYTKTLDQLKNFVLEDDTKYLESIKNGMRSLTLEEVDTKVYVELLISAAEECSYEVSNAIHTNFIEKVSVFKLANQKTLIDLIKKAEAIREKDAAEEEAKRKKEMDDEGLKKKDAAVKALGKGIFDKVTKPGKDNGEDQVEEFNKLDKVKHEDKEYDEKEILTAWLSNVDKGRGFKNWNENKDKISDLLKLYFNNAVCNEDSFTKYADLLVDCLLPCACKKKEVTERKRIVEVETISYKDGSEHTDRKESDEPVKITLENAFSVLALRKADSREKRLLVSIYKENAHSKKDKPSFKKDRKSRLVVDEKKEKLWKSALKLISKNLVKLEEDVILEVIEGMFNEDNMTYQMSEEIMNDILGQFKKLKGLKENDYDTTVETKKDGEGGEDEKETK